MIQLLHDEPEFSNRFIAFMVSRNIRIEEDLVNTALLSVVLHD